MTRSSCGRFFQHDRPGECRSFDRMLAASPIAATPIRQAGSFETGRTELILCIVNWRMQFGGVLPLGPLWTKSTDVHRKLFQRLLPHQVM